MKNLNKLQKKQIRIWLKDYNNKEKQIACPFRYYQCEVCERLFPEVVNRIECPCKVLDVKEVIKRAKEWVK